MIKKEGNDPKLYTITRKSTNARRQSSNGSSSSSSLYNNFHNSPLSQAGSIQIDELDDEFDDDYQDVKQFNDSGSKANRLDDDQKHLKLFAFDNYDKFDRTANLTTNNLSKLNLAANYLNQQLVKSEPFNSALYGSNELITNPSSKRRQQMLNAKKHKQVKRKSKRYVYHL